MSEEAKELICGLLDDQISRTQLHALLASLEQRAELRDRLTVYQLVNDATAGRRALDNGYSLRIIERLQAEPGWQPN